MEPVPDAAKQVVELNLTEIVDGAHFYAQVAGDTAVKVLQEQIATACRRTGASDVGWDPKVGALVCARFTVDDEWYRAKVKERSGGKYTVFFIDYGNVDVVDLKRLKPIDPTLSPQAVSPQAVECRLAYLIVSTPDDEADGLDAATALGEAAWGKPMLARVEDREASGVLLVILFDDKQQNVNDSLVKEGLARVEKKQPKRAATLVKGLYEKELVAKTSHLGMWRYGDIEEEEAVGPRRDSNGRPEALPAQPHAHRRSSPATVASRSALTRPRPPHPARRSPSLARGSPRRCPAPTPGRSRGLAGHRDYRGAGPLPAPRAAAPFRLPPSSHPPCDGQRGRPLHCSLASLNGASSTAEGRVTCASTRMPPLRPVAMARLVVWRTVPSCRCVDETAPT